MKKVKKSLVAAAAFASIGTAGLAGTHVAQAATDTSSDPMSSLVDKLTAKFSLNKNEVQKVFDEERSAREAERETKRSERLQKLVDAGTITAEQKTKIEAKLKELKAEREASKDSMKDLSDDQRKAKMETARTALESWAKENGIDLTKLQGIFRGGHGRFGGPAPLSSSN